MTHPNPYPPQDVPDENDAVPPAFIKRLSQATPQASDTFRQQLAGQLQAEFKRTTRSKAMGWRFPSRTSFRVLAAAMVMLLVAGAALAVNSLVQQWIMGDAGLKAVFEAGKGIPLNLQQTIDGYTVTLEWAYADSGRITIAYTIEGLPGVQYTNLDTDSTHLTTADGKSEFDLVYGEGNALNTSGNNAGSIPMGTMSGNQRTFDTGDTTNQDVLNLRLQIEVYAVTPAKRTAFPTLEPWEALQEHPSRPFVFTFSVPLNSTVRLLNAPQTASDQGITLTLEKVVVAPSQTTVTVCFTPPDATRSWTSMPHLTAGGEAVSGGGGVNALKAGEGQHCDEFIYNTAMMDYKGEWQLEITELVGFGNGSGDDQQRIKGSWRFSFTVP